MSTATSPATAAAAEQAPVQRDWWQRRYTFTGTAAGMVLLLLSMTPSLLPRGPLFQGLVSGFAGGWIHNFGHQVQLVWAEGSALW